MGLKDIFRFNKSRAEPKKPAQRSAWAIVDNENAGISLSALGYTPLSRDPTVRMCVDRIADLISNMTLYLMENTDTGDVRIKDGLSKQLDIHPCKGLTRKAWIQIIVRNMLLEGDGNAVVMPIYKDGLIQDLLPLPAGEVFFNTGPHVEDYYSITYGGKVYQPEELIHFRLNPDPMTIWKGRGYRLALSDVVKTITAGDKVTQTFMNGRYMPSVVVTADADIEYLTTPEGREDVLKKYTSTTPGEPWIIPNGLLDVKTIQPLSLKDLAVSESIELNKKTVAGLLGVPAFLVGCGDFNKDEYNNFIKDKVLSVAKVIEQTLTQSLLISPTRYFKFNIRSLYAYDLTTISTVGKTCADGGILSRNEVRDWLGYEPREGLDEITQLENYIPASEAGNQNKLNSSGGGD